MGCGASEPLVDERRPRPVPAPVQMAPQPVRYAAQPQQQQQYVQQQQQQQYVQQQAQQPRLVAVAPGYPTGPPVIVLPQQVYVQQPGQQQPSQEEALDKDREPMLLLDTTGSMNFASGVNDPRKACMAWAAAPAAAAARSRRPQRKDTVCEALRLLVPRLAEQDSAAQDEEHGGGLRTVTFADGRAHDIGDLSVANLDEKFASIRWDGGTYIMPGWRKLFEVYQEEFGLRPAADRPLALILVLTDGEAADVAEFAYALSNLPPLVYVAVGIVGFGGEHERCLRSFVPVAARQPRVRIVQLDPRGSNAAGLADALERMFRAPVSATAWL